MFVTRLLLAAILVSTVGSLGGFLPAFARAGDGGQCARDSYRADSYRADSYRAEPALEDCDASQTIVVTAGRGEQFSSQVGQSLSVITNETIQTRQSNAVVDLLRSVPGVSFSRNGGIGTATSVFIRGANSNQTLTLIDSVKVNDPSSPGGGFDFGHLLTGTIERIEVVRGAQSVLWGSQAIGGVVNIITHEPGEPGEDVRVHGRGEYGWRNTLRVNANVSGTLGPVGASLGGGYFESDGFSSFNQTRGGTERDGYRNYGGNVKLNIALSDAVSVDIRGRYSAGEIDLDGFAPPSFAFTDTLEEARSEEFIGYAGLKAALLDGRFRSRLGLAYTSIERENFTPDGDQFTQTFGSHGRNLRFEYQGHFDVGDELQSVFGAETEKSSYRLSNFGSPASLAQARLSSLYGELRASPLANLRLTTGLRYDHHDQFGGATQFAASGVYRLDNLLSDGTTTFRASYGQGFLVPSLFQLFSQYGNRALQSEAANSWDASITQSLFGGAVELGATWFHRSSKNQIVFIGCRGSTMAICVDRPFGTYANVGVSRAKGVELAFIAKPLKALTFTANYSWVDAKDRANGQRLARRPRHNANVSLDYAWEFGLKIGATFSYVGDSFDGAANLASQRLDDYELVDVRISYALTGSVEIYGRIENLFDEEYENVLRYGTPRRSAYGGVRLSFR